MKLKRLPDSELEVMMAIWAAGEETPRSSLEEKLRAKGWASNTVNTYLSRLVEKGFIACERKGKTNYYSPLIQEEDYLTFESKSTLSRLYGSSIKNFVVSLCRHDPMNKEEIDELQTLLDQLKRGEGEAWKS